MEIKEIYNRFKHLVEENYDNLLIVHRNEDGSYEDDIREISRYCLDDFGFEDSSKPYIIESLHILDRIAYNGHKIKDNVIGWMNLWYFSNKFNGMNDSEFLDNVYILYNLRDKNGKNTYTKLIGTEKSILKYFINLNHISEKELNTNDKKILKIESKLEEMKNTSFFINKSIEKTDQIINNIKSKGDK